MDKVLVKLDIPSLNRRNLIKALGLGILVAVMVVSTGLFMSIFHMFIPKFVDEVVIQIPVRAETVPDRMVVELKLNDTSLERLEQRWSRIKPQFSARAQVRPEVGWRKQKQYALWVREEMDANENLDWALLMNVSDYLNVWFRISQPNEIEVNQSAIEERAAEILKQRFLIPLFYRIVDVKKQCGAPVFYRAAAEDVSPNPGVQPVNCYVQAKVILYGISLGEPSWID